MGRSRKAVGPNKLERARIRGGRGGGGNCMSGVESSTSETSTPPHNGAAAITLVQEASSTSSKGVWGEFAVAMPQQQASERLAEVARTLSRKGKLPGYRAGSATRGDVVAFHGFGEPWDFEVSAKVAGEGDKSRVWFEGRVLPKSPLIFLIVSVLSVWPGVWLTDSMLKAYFSGYDWNTYLWYIPLTALPVPWMAWRMWTRSLRSAREHAAETIPKLQHAMTGS